MTSNQTIVVFIVLLVYLVGMSFLLSAIGQDIPLNNVGSQSYSLCKNPPLCTEKTFIGGIVTTVGDLPVWANTILIIIPVALLVLLIVLLVLHG
jgi:hypothetical protein